MVYATDYGLADIGISSDQSGALQAAFDAAQALGDSVQLPGFRFSGSVSVHGDASRFPSVYGSGLATQWFPVDQWALKYIATETANGKGLIVDGVSFRDAYLARRKNGLLLSMASGPVKIQRCDFRYLTIGAAANSSYLVDWNTCQFTANRIGLLSSCRHSEHPIQVSGQSVSLCQPQSLMHCGIHHLQSCAFSSNDVGWMLEDPDRVHGGAHISSSATNCIFQGLGCQILVRGIFIKPESPGLSFTSTHFESTQSIDEFIEIDGQEVSCGDCDLESCCASFVQGSPRKLTQGKFSYVLFNGIAAPPIQHKAHNQSLLKIDIASDFANNGSPEFYSDYIVPSFGGVSGGTLTETGFKKFVDPPQVGIGDLHANGVAELVIDNGVAVVSSGVDSGCRSHGVYTNGDDFWYCYFEIKSEAEVIYLPYGQALSARIKPMDKWRAYHCVGQFSRGRRFVRWWTKKEYSSFTIRNLNVFITNNLNEILRLQSRLSL